MVTAQLGTTVLLPRLGPKTVIPLGFAVATAGMAWLTGIGIGSSYASAVLPQLVVIGVGLGLVMPTAMQLATGGVAAEDAGVASAIVNAMQQVGGSVGTALLNTLAASAATDYRPARTRAAGSCRPRPRWRATPPPSGGRPGSSPRGH
ncbi:hypothetical protein GCM10023097_70640 [Streptomyces collinus]|uniref:MFS family permease n=1 Tax=Streptomyces collinus TaxID=42684 RepID=A0AA89TLE9_STRCU|nr:MFS family permease [Streptomyces collinus]